MKKRGRKDSKDRGDQRDKKLRKKDQRRENRIGGILSMTGTVLIAAVIVLCSMLVLPGIFGFHMYHVLSGSMEPAIPVGSVLFVEPAAPETVEEGDVIAFRSGGSVVSHRVVRNRVVEGEFITKGDANREEDMNPVKYTELVGVVTRHYPVMGHVLFLYTSSVGKVYMVCLAACGAMLNILAGRLRNRRAEEDDG